MRVEFHLSMLAAVIAAAAIWPAWVAYAAMSEQEVWAAVERDYGVQVLRIRPDTDDGRNVFLVTVMNPPGDFNEAFQVNTLMVDAETGQLVLQYRHGPSGHRFSDAPSHVPNRQSPDAPRGRTWR